MDNHRLGQTVVVGFVFAWGCYLAGIGWRPALCFAFALWWAARIQAAIFVADVLAEHQKMSREREAHRG